MLIIAKFFLYLQRRRVIDVLHTIHVKGEKLPNNSNGKCPLSDPDDWLLNAIAMLLESECQYYDIDKPFRSGYLTMSSVIGEHDTNKQGAMVGDVLYRKNHVQNNEVLDFRIFVL